MRTNIRVFVDLFDEKADNRKCAPKVEQFVGSVATRLGYWGSHRAYLLVDQPLKQAREEVEECQKQKKRWSETRDNWQDVGTQ
jgi:hypothetical protein